MSIAGLMGGIGDMLSAPRRGTWAMASDMLHGMGIGPGNIQSGEDLTNALGLDPQGPWAKALGLGAEVLGDPLNLLALPIMSRLPRALGQFGSEFRGLQADAGKLPGMMNTATDAAGVLQKAEDAVAAEQMAMKTRHADEVQRLMDAGTFTPTGQSILPEGDELAKLMARDTAGANARDALLPGVSPPVKMMRNLTPGQSDAYQALGLGMPEDGGMGVMTKLGPQRTNAAGRKMGRHVVPVMTPEYAQQLRRPTPPGYVPGSGNPIGFTEDTATPYLGILQGRQDEAKSALMQALEAVMPEAQRVQQGLDSYAIPALGPWESAMMGLGAGSLSTVPYGEMRRQQR